MQVPGEIPAKTELVDRLDVQKPKCEKLGQLTTEHVPAHAAIPTEAGKFRPQGLIEKDAAGEYYVQIVSLSEVEEAAGE